MFINKVNKYHCVHIYRMSLSFLSLCFLCLSLFSVFSQPFLGVVSTSSRMDDLLEFSRMEDQNDKHIPFPAECLSCNSPTLKPERSPIWGDNLVRRLRGKDTRARMREYMTWYTHATVRDLMPLDIGPLYRKLEIAEGSPYGYIPLMASAHLGALNAESFCGRVLRAASHVLTEGNSLLHDEELEMLVILRMNREFMRFMRHNHGELIRESSQRFNKTVIEIDALDSFFWSWISLGSWEVLFTLFINCL